MRKLEGYNSRIERLSELVALLESGKLNFDGLIELESITRELHERSIILRYNAFKEKASDVETSNAEEFEGIEVEVTIEELEEDEVSDEDVPPIDLSIFDTAEDEVNKTDVDSDRSHEDESSSDEKTVEPLVKNNTMDGEEPVLEESVSDEKSNNSETAQSFLDRLQFDDNSVATRFSAGKLETLIGAFGLNQRLRYINDLFDGSSEMFSEAVKMLDSQEKLDNANVKAEELALQHSWDPEEEVVIEFMSFVQRRYA
ncbi:hypothetical protein OAU25_01695 [Crocinitomicaceae bacterium]|nr:hypothetical protein [Crocinitomicaceae bacterium]